MNLVLKTASATQPVDITTAKAHLLVTHDAQDDYITSLIVVATQWVEEYIGRPLITQTWQAIGSGLCDKMMLLPNLKSVTHIKYLDAENTQQTISTDDYVVAKSGLIGFAVKASGASWPTVYSHPEAVEIEFACGYGAAANVPEPINQAILLMVGHLYANREATSPLTIKQVPLTVEALLSPYQIPVIR